MPVYLIVLLLVCFAGLSGLGAAASLREKKQREKRIENSFGKIPSPQKPGAAAGYYNKRTAEAETPEVDARTWDDLDMDAVFSRVNACQSAIGESVLYDQLHILRPDPDVESLTAYFEAQPQARFRAQLCLSKLGAKPCAPLVDLIFTEDCQPLPFPWLYKIFTCLPFLALPLVPFFPLQGISVFIGLIALNVALHYYFARRIQGALAAIGGAFDLLRACKKLAGLPDFPLADRLNSLAAVFRGLSSGIPLGKRQSNADLELMTEAVNALLLRDLRAYNRVLRLLDDNREGLHCLYRLAGLTDTAAALLSFRKGLPFFCAPNFHTESSLLFDAVYHPLLREPVPNTGSFLPNILITGSNASGKSTFLKALAVNAILAQSVGICCARRFALRTGPVISSMAVRDSLLGGESYFIAEIKSLKRILDAVQTDYCLCFVDEILRGTNSVERIAASAAVLSLLRRRDCLCVVASHDLELAHMLSPGYESRHFSERVTAAGVEFDYTLKPGPSDTRNAILLLEQMGFGAGLVQDARHRAEALAAEKEGLPIAK